MQLLTSERFFLEDAFRDVEWADNVQFPTLTHTQSKRLSLNKDEDTNASLFAKWITENLYEMIDKKVFGDTTLVNIKSKSRRN